MEKENLLPPSENLRYESSNTDNFHALNASAARERLVKEHD